MKYQKNPLMSEGFVKNLTAGIITGNPVAALPFGNFKGKVLNKVAKKITPQRLKPVVNPTATLKNM